MIPEDWQSVSPCRHFHIHQNNIQNRLDLVPDVSGILKAGRSSLERFLRFLVVAGRKFLLEELELVQEGEGDQLCAETDQTLMTIPLNQPCLQREYRTDAKSNDKPELSVSLPKLLPNVGARRRCFICVLTSASVRWVFSK